MYNNYMYNNIIERDEHMVGPVRPVQYFHTVDLVAYVC